MEEARVYPCFLEDFGGWFSREPVVISNCSSSSSSLKEVSDGTIMNLLWFLYRNFIAVKIFYEYTKI